MEVLDWPQWVGALLLPGVGGALVAGTVAYLTFRAQNNKERKDEARRAGAAARILRGDYLMWQNALSESFRTGRWWDPLAVTPMNSTADDLRALAEQKDSFGDWSRVGHPDRRFRQLAAMRNVRRRPDRQEVAYLLCALDDARDELSKIDDETLKTHRDAEAARHAYLRMRSAGTMRHGRRVRL